MAWTRIDDKFLMNPKVQSAGAYGMALYLSGLIYCNTNLTDGFIPDVMLPVLCGLAFQTPSKKVADTLVALNLWERVDAGYQVHDFLSFNRSKEAIDLLNKQRAVNGAKHNPQVKQTDTGTGTGIGTGSGSNSVPINPNTLNPNTLIPEKINTSSSRCEKEEGEVSPVVEVFTKLTGLKPKQTSEEIELIARFVGLGVTPEEYGRAIQDMQAKRYKIATMKSTETWVMNNRTGNRKQAGADLDKFRALYEQQKANN